MDVFQLFSGSEHLPGKLREDYPLFSTLEVKRPFDELRKFLRFRKTFCAKWP